MTSKILVTNGGDNIITSEIFEINQAELITKAALSAGEEPPTYKPMF